MSAQLPEVEVKVPCVEGQEHPVRLRIHDWENWEIVQNPCSELLGHAFGLMSPCSAYVRERGPKLRKAVVEALAQVGSAAVPALREALGDSGWRVREAACWASGEIGDISAVPALREASRDWGVRWAAQEALEQIAARPDRFQRLTDAARRQGVLRPA
ncbi:hypothetical protein HRbin15_01226 [bacterium HR15]|nr:hypothetical protein HRbin15_01226 [bacterium HR15]